MDPALVQQEFARNFAERGELGAACAVWQGEELVLDLAGGWADREETRPWTSATPVLFFSATKGPAVATVHGVAAAARVPLTRPVAAFWPEFAAAGKSEITLAQVLSHQAGLPALREEVPVQDHPAVAAALAAMEPWWPAGTAHGYHPRTFGYLLDEIVRRLSGQTLGDVWRRQWAKPLGLDLWIGLPADRVDAPATVYPARRAPPKGDPFYSAFLTSGSLTSRSFASPKGLNGPAAMSTPEARQASYPAFGGIGTARSLAQFYAVLAQGGVWQGRRYLPESSVAAMSQSLVQGPDLVLLGETAFTAGFMQDPIGTDGRKVREVFGPSRRAFGQPGAGGSHAFADPEHGLAFAYLMNQMEPGVLPGEKALRLVQALYI